MSVIMDMFQPHGLHILVAYKNMSQMHTVALVRVLQPLQGQTFHLLIVVNDWER